MVSLFQFHLEQLRTDHGPRRWPGAADGTGLGGGAEPLLRALGQDPGHESEVDVWEGCGGVHKWGHPQNGWFIDVYSGTSY